eukprot:6177097-Pleurochrysis_carterae.AAC.2
MATGVSSGVLPWRGCARAAEANAKGADAGGQQRGVQGPQGGTLPMLEKMLAFSQAEAPPRGEYAP